MKRHFKEVLTDCMDVLEQWIDGEEPRVETKILLKELYERTEPTIGRFRPDLTPHFEVARSLVAKGATIKDACIQAGITREQWYRRKRMEEFGRDRVEKREY